MLCKLTLNCPLSIIQKNNIHLALKDTSHKWGYRMAYSRCQIYSIAFLSLSFTQLHNLFLLIAFIYLQKVVKDISYGILQKHSRDLGNFQGPYFGFAFLISKVCWEYISNVLYKYWSENVKMWKVCWEYISNVLYKYWSEIYLLIMTRFLTFAKMV